MKGQLITIKKIYSLNEEQKIYDEDGESSLLLGSERTYSIPKYQREMRWNTKQVSQLLNDIKNGKKYLGQIIFKKTNTNIYDVIDGQQRMTVINIVLNYVRYKVGDVVNQSNEYGINDNELKNESFPYIIRCLYEDGQCREEEDLFKQKDIIDEIFMAINKFFEENYKIEEWDSEGISNFINNLNSSKISVSLIENESDDLVGFSIEKVFLDINDKGKKLDEEDLYKAYLFSVNNSDSNIINLWVELKKEYFKLDERVDSWKSLSSYIKSYYSIINDLPEIDKTLYVKGNKDHIIQEINNSARTLEHTENMITYLKLLSPDKIIEEYFSQSDSYIKYVFKNMLETIMYQKNEIPKNYLLKILHYKKFSDENKDQQRKNFITWYVYSIFFITWKAKKDASSEGYKEQDIESTLIRNIEKVLNEDKVASNFESYTLDNDDKKNYVFKAISFIYDNIDLKKMKIIDFRNSKNYLQNKTIEHFITNSGKYKVEDNEEKIKYESHYKKYKNKINNLVLISEDENEELGSKHIAKKKEIMNEWNEIEDNYMQFWKENGIYSLENLDSLSEEEFSKNHLNFNNKLKKCFQLKINKNI